MRSFVVLHWNAQAIRNLKTSANSWNSCTAWRAYHFS